jgi:magnesium-transporting ATPase (P-type)
MMLRGCKLKNTDWAIGITVYTGTDTAIMMNSSQPFTKISNIERKVNNLILLILLFEILCAFGSAIYCYFGCINYFAF